MRAVAITTLFCAAAGLLGAAEKRLAAGQAENDTVRISATVLDAAHLRDAVGSDLGEHYVAVEVKITPKGSEPLVVSLNDFILRSQASGDHSGPLVASQILGAGALVLSRTYANRSGPGEPRLIEGTKVELKNDVPDAASKALEDKLKESILPEKTTAEPFSGLLFFPLEKEKPKNLALSYSGPKGKLRIEFQVNPAIGTRVEDLDTPALLVDLGVMERNLVRVADYCARHGLRLRPHTKTHKSKMLARRQLDLGAAGLTVAKTGEAEIMAETGTSDLLVAFPVIGEMKLRRLGEVARKTRVTLALDSLAAARALSQAAVASGVTFGLLIEMDVGLGRVGVLPEEAPELARACSALPGIEVRGLTFYPGHIREQNEEQIRALSLTVAGAQQAFTRAGAATEIVSGGSTPLLFRSHEVEGVNEIRPGTYIFNDMNTVRSGGCGLEDCAASVLVTVVSHARRERMIVDGGSKTFSSDVAGAGGEGFGRLMEAPGAAFVRMNEEHGFIDLTAAERDFEIGQKTQIIPNHICVAVNLHEQIYGVRRGVVEQVWQPEARGKLQ